MSASDTPVAISAFAVWTPAGVWVNAAPPSKAIHGLLAPWPEAPLLTEVHPGARRPPRQATVLVQLAHALLAHRRSIDGDGPPSPPPATMDLLLGTERGSETEDVKFLQSISERGSAFGSPSIFVYTLATASPAEVALALGLRGALATLTAGSVSGLSAVVAGARHVAHGRSQACLSGGIEVGGRAGPNAGEAEVAALFLLEPAAARCAWPTIAEAELGFEPEATAGTDSATTTLLALASACGAAQLEKTTEIAGHSREGHWARVRLRW